VIAVDVDAPSGVAVVTLDRPEARNALSSDLLRRLTSSLMALEADASIGAVILTGADPAFCAGLDLKEVGDKGSVPGGPEILAARGGPVPAMSKPLIGAVNGPAITGGLELALNCDFLVASERAAFGDTHARVGLQPGWGGAVLLVEAIGVRRAREMSFTGNFVGAEEALRIGLVNHVTAHDDLVPFCRGLAADIVSSDGQAVRRLRQTYAEVADAVAAGGWEAESAAVAAWQGRSFDPREVERRREAVRSRGREQTT
jgi:enoyl-CoA hydratase